ncbi:hypothetical protein FQA39_LY12635 [Lamprigera yunnana]|nr:hypothetical protein FQA39_LY12635 [Lamprigera yunnana]
MGNKQEEFVNVAVRIKPSLNILEDSIGVKVVSKNPAILYASNRQSYTFNHIYTDQATQEMIYDDLVKPLISKVLQGYNSTIFAYGQTGTGKTYTMGSDPKTSTDPGFILRTLEEIFGYQEKCPELTVFISFYEIYNEKVFDLLNSGKTSLTVKDFKIEGLNQIKVDNSVAAQNLLNIGSRNRHIGGTKLNMSSSRSHGIFTIFCNIQNEKFGSNTKLNLVDLAGSENARKTGNEGSQFQEGVNINKSLFNVGHVIRALSTNSSHIPYRDSMITTILRDSLNNTNFITLIACISPDLQDKIETIQTLEFAKNTKKLKHKPEIQRILRQYEKKNPNLYQNTCSTVKKRMPLTYKIHSSEFSTPCVTKKPIINHTWTPSSTIPEPHNKFNPQATLSPIVRKYVQAFESAMKEKLEELQFSWRKIQTEVSDVHSTVMELTKKTLACSSPLEGHGLCDTCNLLPEEHHSTLVPKQLAFDDTIFKKPLPKKRKMKLSLDKSTICPRRSIRLSKTKEVECTTGRRSLRLEKKSLNQTSFTMLPKRTISTPRKKANKQSKKINDHYNDMLDILNNGDQKDLQKLPTIGVKTATQICLYRKVHGPFHKIEDLKKTKINTYQKFLNANFLNDM